MRRSHVDRDRDQRGIHDEGSAIAIAIPALDPHRDGRGVRPAIAIAMADRDEKAAVSGKSHRARSSVAIANRDGFWDVWNEPNFTCTRLQAPPTAKDNRHASDVCAARHTEGGY